MSTPATRRIPAQPLDQHQNEDAIFVDKTAKVEVAKREIDIIVRAPMGGGKSTAMMLFEAMFQRFYHHAEPSPVRIFDDEGVRLGYRLPESSDLALKKLFDNTTFRFMASDDLTARERLGLPTEFSFRTSRDQITPKFAFGSGPGYHLGDIPAGQFGEFSKIEEEVAEARDAVDQGCKVMELVELSDLVGAIEGYLDKHHPGMTLDDLRAMSAITHRAFNNGHRAPKVAA